MSQAFIQTIIDALVVVATDLLMPLMMLVFLAGIVMRGLVYYTVKRQEWFAREFEKRVDIFAEQKSGSDKSSFTVQTKRLLEKTYYELFEVRSFLKRRKPDFIMALSDRVFLIQQGSAWFVRDILKQIKHLPFSKDSAPKIFDITKKTLSRNPCFNKVFGIIPASVTTDVLNLLPGVFIVLGIFGTFLGIMQALPELGNMNLDDIEGTKMVMDKFLLEISFSMSTSLIGIILSLGMSFLNAFLSPNKAFINAVERMESALNLLWNLSSSNDSPVDLPIFDEHRDPMEALAEQAVDKEIQRGKKVIVSQSEAA